VTIVDGDGTERQRPAGSLREAGPCRPDMATAPGLRAGTLKAHCRPGVEGMRTLEQLRWAALLALVVLLAATTANAQEGGTVTLKGTFVMDSAGAGTELADIVEDGAEYTYVLTMYDTTYEHGGWSGALMTSVYATSMDIAFSGPGGEALTQVVNDELAGGEFRFNLVNFTNGGSTLMLWLVAPEGYAQGLSFWTGHESEPYWDSFPVDANGYPTVESEPFALSVEGPWIIDNRPGNSGAIGAVYSDATIEGDIGTPGPSPVQGTLGVLDTSVVEGDRGTQKVRVAVQLSRPSSQTVSVSYRTVDGTAHTKSDYNGTSGSLTFQPGEIAKTITITIKSDRKPEPSETFTVQIYNAVGAEIADGVATVTILDND